MRRKISYIFALLLVLSALSLSLTSCDGVELYSEGNGALKVVTTIFAPFDFAREVGGERITVTLLQDNGADLHNYTPTSATLDALASADVFIYIGGVSDEAWVDQAIEASGNKKLTKLCLMDFIDPVHAELQNDWSGDEHDHEHEHEEDHSHEGHDHSADEHIWTSVRNVMKITEKICEVFSSADQDGAEYYAERAASYAQKLSALDAKLHEIFEGTSIPVAVIADRFPFVYLFHDYHMPYIAAFSGCSTEINASFDTQVKLINAVTDNSLPFVLTIEGGDKVLAKTISVETGCSVASIDSMQSVKRGDIEAGATYISIMEKNISVLEEVFS